MKKVVIVIGASGFIGTYLVDELLKNGYEVITTGRNKCAENYFNSKGCKHIQLDITNKKEVFNLPTENVCGVILLAALLPANVQYENTYDYIDVNITGTVNVLEFCRRNGIKKLISTTSYADVRNFWNESCQIKSDSLRSYDLSDDHALYIVSKNAASDIMIYYNHKFDMKCSIFRLPPVYGVGPHSALYVDGKWKKSGFQIFVEKAMAGEPITIYGNKDAIRDIVYVKDVTQAFVKCLNSNISQGIYNIASGDSSSLENQVKDIIEVFSNNMNKSKIILDPTICNNSSSYLFDISRATADFGYIPQYVPFRKLVHEYKEDLKTVKIPHLKNQYND